MIGDGKLSASHARRCVLLTRDAALAASLGGRAGVAHFASGYEAAAELLAGKAQVLAIDLADLVSRHAHLLEIARRRGVEVLAFGRSPGGLDADALRGIRLVGRDELPAAIAGGSTQQQPAGPPAEANQQGRYVAEPPPRTAGPAAPKRPVEPPHPTLGSEKLLTADEIAALLENGP
jgi:hypothetical protein